MDTRSTTAKSTDPRRVGDPRRAAPEQTADSTQKARTRTHFVDPYDMHADAQPEEPGYGHGV